jgi:hypothetical protein
MALSATTRTKSNVDPARLFELAGINDSKRRREEKGEEVYQLSYRTGKYLTQIAFACFENSITHICHLLFGRRENSL